MVLEEKKKLKEKKSLVKGTEKRGRVLEGTLGWNGEEIIRVVKVRRGLEDEGCTCWCGKDTSRSFTRPLSPRREESSLTDL